MLETIHDFFFGDQRRKYIALIGSIVGGQILSILLLGESEPYYYILLTIGFSIVLTLPIAVLYDTVYAAYHNQWAKRLNAAQHHSLEQTDLLYAVKQHSSRLEERMQELTQTQEQMQAQMREQQASLTRLQAQVWEQDQALARMQAQEQGQEQIRPQIRPLEWRERLEQLLPQSVATMAFMHAMLQGEAAPIQYAVARVTMAMEEKNSTALVPRLVQALDRQQIMLDRALNLEQLITMFLEENSTALVPRRRRVQALDRQPITLDRKVELIQLLMLSLLVDPHEWELILELLRAQNRRERTTRK
jgi:hypothetical protein